ncbi:hypothetical protein Cni_G27751 [Canna indica]|uniref:ATP binding protein n=1 Tax=Canna indica TaxID=4628 RepID=A0AAQ3L2A1_9LILI|nr:hypothetical protein Cni_G27751 [Canna indica]
MHCHSATAAPTSLPSFPLTGRCSFIFPSKWLSSYCIVNAMEVQDADLPQVESPNLAPHEAPRPDAALSAELESLRSSHRELESRLAAAEESLSSLRIRNIDLSLALNEASEERDSLRIKLIEAEVSAREEAEANWIARLELSHEIEILKSSFGELTAERSRRDGMVSEILDSIRSAGNCFRRIRGRISDGNLGGVNEEKSNLEDALELLLTESKSISELGAAVDSMFVDDDIMRRKERKELENSIVSLTEENRDMSTLLRVALVEKEAIEKSLNKLKVSGEQKKGAILQIAERGLQKVGFGFVIGVIGGESQSDQPSSSAISTNSDGSECDEEVISLASTVEKMMKNLRLEITELRQVLEESRSENEQLQSVIDEQAQKTTQREQYIKDLEERENILTKSVEELMLDTKEAEEEATRWREACELEVEAAKAVILEREKEVALLREELKRTKSALDAANNKLQLKEKLAKTAMAAQAAAEATLQLADKRSAGFRERIEELTRQLEEEAAEGSRRERSAGVRRRVRYVCWPWQAFRVMPAASPQSRERIRRRMMVPEMESLLRFSV